MASSGWGPAMLLDVPQGAGQPPAPPKNYLAPNSKYLIPLPDPDPTLFLLAHGVGHHGSKRGHVEFKGQ